MGYGGAFDLGINPRDNFDRLLDAWRSVPLNLLPLARRELVGRGVARGSCSRWGAGGFKVHEDIGAYPELVDAALSVAERHDVQLALHADGIGESATLEETLAAIGGRGVHFYHVEGCGGGPVDLLEAVEPAQRAPLVDQPDVPFGATAAAEHEDMIRTVHRLHPRFENDLAASRGRIRELDHGRRERPPRPGRDQHDELRLDGHGADRRGHAPDLAARARDEARRRRGDAERQRARRCATSPS